MHLDWSGKIHKWENNFRNYSTASSLKVSAPMTIDEAWIHPQFGVNYASASAGILPKTGTAFGKNYCVEKQINFFKETVENVLGPKFQSTEKLSEHLSNSIFLIHIGSSDYIHNYLQPDDYNSSRQYNGKKFAELLTSKLGNYLKDLYSLGARRILIFQVGPLGSFPYIINKVKPRSRCAEDVNKLASGFNDKLNAKLIELTKTLHGSKFVTVKTFNLIRSMIQNPTDYGFEDTRWQCCPTQENGTGLCKERIIREVSPAKMSMPDEEEKRREFRRSFACLDVSPGKFSQIGIGKPKEDVCDDRKLYIFWDELHLTEAAYKIIVDKCFAILDNICSPYNILANLVEENICTSDSCMFHQY
ncbi:GDSL esterase/lipase 7 [Camellia lanceoleosa]|uniref:GDSL esterase/lipase 7 n=1 Tax=Camellia lanceoleosa TaxID=1840588 RepID=A0ACC0G1P5_9ERIC|nr:GDSL esterase/lipase 7 [Camellia lanceoleosa]